MSQISGNPFLNKLPKNERVSEIGFLVVLFAILILIGLAYLALHFAVPLIEQTLI